MMNKLKIMIQKKGSLSKKKRDKNIKKVFENIQSIQ